jgi:DNA repair protein REV1
MDSFFASVVLRNYPQYRNKPVAISHHGKGNNNNNSKSSSHEPPDLSSVSKNSTSECATCNYKAREYGIKKGMFLGRAKQLCPELVVLYYDFDGYEEVSAQVLEILHKLAAEHKGTVEAVSCDEAYVELFLDDDEASHIAESTRIAIFETTQCTASIGVADNKFLAKLGTDRAKPDGSFVVVDYKDLLKDLKLRDLHGIGYRSEPKLTAEGLVHVQDIWDFDANAEGILCRILGPALGRKIFDYCQGKDDRPVKSAERKTIGAEVSVILFSH